MQALTAHACSKTRNPKESDTYQLRTVFWLVQIVPLDASYQISWRKLMIWERLEVRFLERRLGRFREKEEYFEVAENEIWWRRRRFACRKNCIVFFLPSHQRSASTMLPPGFHYQHPIYPTNATWFPLTGIFPAKPSLHGLQEKEN